MGAVPADSGIWATYRVADKSMIRLALLPMTFPEPPALAQQPTCFFHTDRATGRRCTRCGRYACPECLTTASVGSHCWECIKAAQPPLTQQVKAKLAQPLLVTRSIIALNVLVFVVQLLNGEGLGSGLGGGTSKITSFDGYWGLVRQGVAGGQVYRMVTSGFIHFGLLHIGFNMLILYRLGEQLESGIGRLRFATIYIASLLGGSFAMLFIGSGGTGGGASGAVFGMAGAATIALRQRGLSFSMTGWGPMLIFNLVLTFTMPNIGVGAHLGGLATGCLLGAILLHPQRTKSQTHLGYAIAALIVAGSLGVGYVYTHNKYPSCITSGLDVACTDQDWANALRQPATSGSSSNVPVASSSISR